MLIGQSLREESLPSCAEHCLKYWLLPPHHPPASRATPKTGSCRPSPKHCQHSTPLPKSCREPVRGRNTKAAAGQQWEKYGISMQALMETLGASAQLRGSWSTEGDGSGRAVSDMLGVGAAATHDPLLFPLPSGPKPTSQCWFPTAPIQLKRYR